MLTVAIAGIVGDMFNIGPNKLESVIAKTPMAIRFRAVCCMIFKSEVDELKIKNGVLNFAFLIFNYWLG
jgi:hypothetical protein